MRGSRQRNSALWALLLFLPCALAFKAHDFKLCHQTAFCRRGRAIAGRAEESKNWESPYSVDAASVVLAPDQASLTAAVKSSLYPDIKFAIDLRVHEDGVVRVRMDEVDGLRKRYDEAASWALIKEPTVSRDIRWTAGKNEVKAVYGSKSEFEIVLTYDPLRVTLYRNGKEQIVLNGRGLLHMEHFRKKEEQIDAPAEGADGDAQEVMKSPSPRAWFEGDAEDGYWDETWVTWTDSKPKGPESLSLDISYPNHAVVYGIPQHATDLALPSTTGEGAKYSDPFRLWNSDVFEYTADGITSLYGSIPVMHAHSADSTVAVFNAVGSETWIDVQHKTSRSTETHWISESGILDVFIMPGPTPADVFQQYARLTGTLAMPAHWALGYHQCRWNYFSSDDVRGVQKRFDEEDMPFDVIWLDIEYAPDHKYFIWKEKEFPDPIEMVNDVAAYERKMVVIIDPHLKRVHDYPVYKQATDLGVLVKDKSGEGEYEGWCWPGSSAWVDMFNPKSWAFWKKLFKTKKVDGDFVWEQSTEDVFIWNDMNEPSVFNGPEISMPRDNVHHGGWEHRDIHNINGMLFSNLTSQALVERSNPAKRPFVLTRSFFAGSQRFGAMWTGDNLGTWEHMAVGNKMVLANNIAGMSFAGSDVGGFFGNPEPEMLVRWYQVGIWNPFFRAHGHIDTKRREPYLLDDPHKSTVRDLLRLRYAMLPVWYTAFHEASVTGMPIVRPQYVIFPQDEAGFALDEQFWIGGSGLLVKPVTKKGAVEESMYLADNQVYYDYISHQTYRGAAKGKTVTVPAALHQTPLLLRGGSILPTRERPRRSSPLMKHDPFTLTVALDSQQGSATGELYLDDGTSFDYQQGHLVWRTFSAVTAPKKSVTIRSQDLVQQRPTEAADGVSLTVYDPANAYARSAERVRVEKVLVLGLAGKPKSVKVEGGKELDWDYTPGVAASDKKDGTASVLAIKDPGVSIVADWSVVINL